MAAPEAEVEAVVAQRLVLAVRAHLEAVVAPALVLPFLAHLPSLQAEVVPVEAVPLRRLLSRQSFSAAMARSTP